MEFLLYLTPEAQDILNQVYRAKYNVRENIEYCISNKTIFGYVDFKKNLVICTNNIKKGNFSLEFYVNETIYHEAVHVAHMCNGYRPFGISMKSMLLPSNKLQDVKNSSNLSNSSDRFKIEHEAYWMEDKPNEIKYVLQKYCF